MRATVPALPSIGSNGAGGPGRPASGLPPRSAMPQPLPIPTPSRRRLAAAVLLAAAASACAPAPPPRTPPSVPRPPATAPAPPPSAPTAPPVAPRVEPLWEVERPEEGLVDLAVWPGAGARSWLLATAGATDRLLVFDAATGEPLRELGASGERPGRFRGPAGIAVLDDLAFVAESGNARVQVLRLPGLSTVGFVGAGALSAPLRVAVERAEGGYAVWVADRAAAGGDELRLRRFRFHPDGSSEELVSTAVAVGGGAASEGSVTALEADPAAGHLLVVVARPGTGSVALREGEEGPWAGGVAVVAGPLGGAALYPCPGGDGWWLLAGRDADEALFAVLDRGTLAPVASFAAAGAPAVALWVLAAATPELPAGAVYALREGGGISAFDWRRVAARLGLRADCAL